MTPQEEDHIVISEKAANISIVGGIALGFLGVIIWRSGADTIWLLFASICFIVAPILLVLGVAARPNVDVRMGDRLASGVARFLSMALGSLLLTGCFADLNPFDIAKIKIIHIFVSLLGVFLVLLGLIGSRLLSQPLRFVGLDPAKVAEWLLRICCLYISFSVVVMLVSDGQFITLLKNDPGTLVKLVTGAIASFSVGVGMGYWAEMLRGFNKTK
jgi:hypothetical protein